MSRLESIQGSIWLFQALRALLFAINRFNCFGPKTSQSING